MHRLTGNDARSLNFNAHALVSNDRALAVDRVAETVNHATEQALADRNVHDGAGALNSIALADFSVGAENHDTDVVGFEVQGHALNAIGEFDHFTGLDLVESVDAGNAVTDREDRTDFRDLGLGAEAGDLVLNDL